MVNPRHLDFSEDSSPSTQSLPKRKSSRKLTSNSNPSPPSEPVPEQVTNKSKNKNKNNTKNKKLSSPLINRIWSEEDELTVLKGLVEYQAKTGVEPKSNWDEFYRFVGGGSVSAKFSKDQLLSKISKLKGKFFVLMQRISQGNDQIFPGSNKAEAFRLSTRIWGPKDSIDSKTDEETCKEDEEITYHEPLSENVVAKSDLEGNDDDADVSSALRDAFETMMSGGLSDYQKKLQLEKLMNLGSGKRKELSDEWKALCAEEVKLNIKKFRFSAMLAEAANGF